MQTTAVQSAEALDAALAVYGDQVLYRGQTGHFATDQKSGLRTSFDRHGCIPPVMVKWSHYAEFMLRQIADDPSVLDRLEFVQAILQHYGWRSFFLDLSESPAVSAFFAGQSWKHHRHLDLIEDCFEDPVFAMREVVHYEPAQGEGNLYVVSKAALAEAGVGLHNLAQLSLGTEGRPRYMFQRAWLAGPLRDDLPMGAVVGHIAGPASVFRDYASRGGFSSGEDLFPRRRTDPILDLLLSLPWELIKSGDEGKAGEIEFFRRALNIPEYNDEGLEKRQPSSAAFFRGETIAGYVKDPTLTVRQVPSIVIFGSSKRPPEFPRVSDFVRRHKRVLFEVNDLIWLPETLTSATWGKGLWVEERPDGLMQVGDLVVEHPGRQLAGFGANRMWSYRVDETGRWARSPQNDDCPCSNQWRHEAHLSALSVLEDDFARRERVFRGKT